MTSDAVVTVKREGSPLEVLLAFFRLGLSSFGGPIAHLGYFRSEFVTRRRWLSESQYAELIALCQFLPGPASSQVGFALGLQRAGWLGALAAFIGFTLPSACLLVAFAAVESAFAGPIEAAVVSGLKLAAVCVVAHAVVGMARQLTPDFPRAALAASVCALMLWSGNPWMQLAAIALGAALGNVIHRTPASAAPVHAAPRAHRVAVFCLLAFALLLALSLRFSAGDGLLHTLAGFYRAGALVFGGAHVVLPLLEDVVVGAGRLTADEFLAGYGAAQAIPGPMFSVSAYFGMKLAGLGGALLCVVAMFLPGFLVLAGALPFWNAIRTHRAAAATLAGVNAAVVGIVAAALYDPVWVSAVDDPMDVLIAATGIALLLFVRVSPLTVAALCVGASVLRVI